MCECVAGWQVPVLEHYRPKGVCCAANSNQSMEKVWAEVEAGLTTGKK